MSEGQIICHGPDGKPCGRLTEQESERLAAAGKGMAVHSRKGELVRFMLYAMPENIESRTRDSVWRIERARKKFGDVAVRRGLRGFDHSMLRMQPARVELRHPSQ